MPPFNYGTGISCEFESDRVVHLQAARAESLSHEEVIARVGDGLCQPLSYPPLSQATVPGDRVVVALAEGVPQPLAIVEGVLLALRDAGVETALTSLLVSARFGKEREMREKLDQLGATDCAILKHSPEDESEIALFGVSSQGLPLRLSRVLCDADLVLSVGLTNQDPESSFNGLYPGFSDRETYTRLQTPLDSDDPESSQQRSEEITEAGWMLGLGMIIQVVPGPDETVCEILIGDPRSVSEKAQECYRSIWSCSYEIAPDLVIATVSGLPSEQTWFNLGRALAASRSVVQEGGSVVLLSEISDLPGESFQSLSGNEDYDLAEREILRGEAEDSWAAWQLCRALDGGSVYLWSQLPPGVVESLGMTPISSEVELERLVQVNELTCVLEEAQRLLPAPLNSNCEEHSS